MCASIYIYICAYARARVCWRVFPGDSYIVHPGDSAGIHFSVWSLAKAIGDRPDACMQGEAIVSNMGDNSVVRITVCEPQHRDHGKEDNDGTLDLDKKNPVRGLEVGVQGRYLQAHAGACKAQ